MTRDGLLPGALPAVRSHLVVAFGSAYSGRLDVEPVLWPFDRLRVSGLHVRSGIWRVSVIGATLTRMRPVQNCCGIDAEELRRLKEELAAGKLVTILHKPTGRLGYVTPEELAAMRPEEYTLYKSSLTIPA